MKSLMKQSAKYSLMLTTILAASAVCAADLAQEIGSAGDISVTLGEVLAFQDQIGGYNGDATTENLQNLVEQLILQKKLAQSVEIDEVLEIKIAAARDSVLSNYVIEQAIKDGVTEEFIQSQYDELVGETPPMIEWQASHILVDSEDEANAVLARINAGEDFAELARELSKDPGSGANGGDLGYFSTGMMVPEFEAAVQNMEVGEVSPIVQTDYGYHIIKLVDEREAPKPTLDEVREQLVPYVEQVFVEDYIANLLEGTEVTLAEGADASLLETPFE